MKLAITIWTERVAPVFDVAGHFLLIEKDEAGVFTQTEISLTPEMALDRTSFLLSHNVDELICGAISKPVYNSTISNGIKVFPFVSGKISDVLDAWKSDRLNNLSYSMPGCRRGGCKNQNRPRRNCRNV